MSSLSAFTNYRFEKQLDKDDDHLAIMGRYVTLRRGEHVKLFEKLEGETLEQRQRLRLHDIEDRLYRNIILQDR